MKHCVSIAILPVLLLFSPSIAAVRFGAISSFTDAERVKYFTPTCGGGVDILTESVYDVYTPYDGMYLWARYDRRLDSLSSILPIDGTIIINITGTPAWNSGWWSGSSFCEGEKNQRHINDFWYADFLEALICRYGTNGVRELSQGRRVSNWSLWCEPDGGQQMMGRQEYLHCGDLARERAMVEYFTISSIAAERIRTTDANATIISGSFLSPASPPGSSPSQWEYWARWCLQLCLSGEHNASGPVDFGWAEGPDVFDWHPYDDFVQNDNNIETYYDPLVIDSNDLMYRYRCDSLAESFLDELFTDDPNEPVWNTMPQYLLEFCPTYTLARWRLVHTIEPADFHSMWRANYHITSCIMLAESSHLSVLTPWLAGSGQWWAGPDTEDYMCIPMPDTLWPSPADRSYQFLTSRFNNLECKNYISSILSRGDDLITGSGYVQGSYHLAHWTFGHATDELPSIHALRTYRDSNFFPYDENMNFNVRFPVSSNVDYLEQYSLLGEYEGLIYPDLYGYVTITVNGYMKYAIECLSSDLCELSSNVISEDRIGSTASSTRVRVFDLSGRLVMSYYVNDEQCTSAMYNASIMYGRNMPAGCYIVAMYDESNQIICTQKVTVLE